MLRPILMLLAALAALPATAETLVLEPVEITEWKAVYGEVETRDRVPARARIGGTVVELTVTEGDRVEAGQQIARVEDDKLAFQLRALDAQLTSLENQLDTAQTDLDRGAALRERGVITQQRLDQLRTQVEVLQGQIESTRAERRVIEQQVTEGAVLSPDNGVVLSVPISLGSVINPGETVAEIGGGGVFLRLSIPERHATTLQQGGEITLGAGSGMEGTTGRLAKVYPQIEGGRVLADVEVAGLDGRFVGRRVPVRLPVGSRSALLVPDSALTRRAGLDFVTVRTPQGMMERSVVPGELVRHDGQEWREILSGLFAGDRVVTEND
ncbi:efflux RND transporter periplasmic adaptor subunit [Rhodovulum adriaticum]|uniref:RND family efflux transporter MFP subunit n=1 Tax=Rhodovulum adriaticum TaxID=35804 RepID=A0A4R2P0H9_RHOAD|nr:efflux RND transporter periplasmic adaptor subunit [Rhodovulum adriaticum]MBK1636851.1 efflux transporter periplasmic adaptor subunit [Rhodovulum adriaticum]TCP27341.1 RND family efflux transporter MFP subunit [Rhodovulum adriaticum]